VSKITLFFAAGSIYTAAHLTEVSQLDGLARRQPWTFAAFLVGALSIIGLPPFIGLWSKWWIGVGAAEANEYWVIAVLMISSLLNVAYLLPIVARGWFVPEPEGASAPKIQEAPVPAVAALTITAILCVVLFVAIGPLMELVSQIEVQAPAVPAETGGQNG
ncbi:MAG: proton-conducting transporter membrane subunit, partial [Pseudomonadota bacterium]